MDRRKGVPLELHRGLFPREKRVENCTDPLVVYRGRKAEIIINNNILPDTFDAMRMTTFDAPNGNAFRYAR
jgi:hypothetical protein